MSGRSEGPKVPVAVSGASGFIGECLCRRLRELGHPVTAILRTPRAGPWTSVVQHDFGTGPLPAGALAGQGLVYHLAGRAHATDDPASDAQPYLRVNVSGTDELIAAASQAGVRRIVYASSVKAMGERTTTCLDEDAQASPETAYGRSKLDAESALFAAANAGGPEAVALRLCMVHGPQHRGNLARMFSAVARRRFPPLAIHDNRRSVVHVDDVVNAAIAAGDAPRARGRVYLVVGPTAYSTAEMHALMCRALGRETPRVLLPVAFLRPLAWLGDGLGRACGRRFAFDSTALARLTESACYSGARLAREVGYRPVRGLEDTLDALAEAWANRASTP